jgi:hypothetical protein
MFGLINDEKAKLAAKKHGKKKFVSSVGFVGIVNVYFFPYFCQTLSRGQS